MVEQAEPGETGEEKDERPEPLSEKQLNEVPIAIEVFTMEVVCRVHVHMQNNYYRGSHTLAKIIH